LPLIKDGVTQLVLDIDSAHLNTFDDVDAIYLEQLIDLIKQKHYS